MDETQAKQGNFPNTKKFRDILPFLRFFSISEERSNNRVQSYIAKKKGKEKKRICMFCNLIERGSRRRLNYGPT